MRPPRLFGAGPPFLPWRGHPCPRTTAEAYELVKLHVAIDGPAASGKSTVARLLAARLGGYCVNTGEMYRAITWAVLACGVDPREAPQDVVARLPGLELRYVPIGPGELSLVLNGEPVPREAVRAPDVARAVSFVARIPEVRSWLLQRQREATALGTVVMEGRDIGTVVLPDAPLKVFITATPEVRARRRLRQDGETAPGATVASVAAEIAARDEIDSRRAVAPLRTAADAHVVDSSDLTVEQVVDRILALAADVRSAEA